MKKHIIIGFVGLALEITVCMIIIFAINPLLKPTGWIRNDLLKLTPVGTRMDDVLAIIENIEKWDFKIDNMVSWPPDSEDEASEFIDYYIRNESMRFVLGTYTFIFKTYVTVEYKLDENLKLIDIIIDKEADLP